MRRSAVAIVTGLCTAPLFAFLGFCLADLLTGSGGGTDSALANAYLVVLIGLVSGLIGGLAAAGLTAYRLPERWYKAALCADSALVIAMIIGWQLVFAEPAVLEYADARPQLDVEIRVPTALGAQSVGAIAFIEGLLDNRHDDLVRADGDFVILPWDTTPYRVREWAVQIMLDGHQNWTRFEMDLPRRPTQSTDWSEWVLPTTGDAYDVVDGVTLRYRFRLIPHGQ